MKTHENADKNIRCNADQYAGNLYCSGTGVAKTISTK